MNQNNENLDDDIQIRQRTVSLNKKFPEIKMENELSQENIWLIVEKLNLSELIDKEKAKELFELLDEDKKGKIRKSTFVEYLLKYTQKLNNSSFNSFFEIINNELSSKSEKIINKLKNLRLKESIKNDLDSVNDINWIIKEILDSDLNNDLNDVEINSLNNLESQIKKIGNPDHRDTVEYITQFSKYWDLSRKTSDLTKVHKMYQSTKQLPTQKLITEEIEVKDQMRGSYFLNSINYIHSATTKLAELLKNIDKPEFDVFEVDSIVNRKTMYLISKEIFDEHLFLDFMDKDKFKEFIGNIILGYDRKVTYHNDLHATDVLQTTYLVLKVSDLQMKINLQAIDVLSIYISAIIHDFKHPGFTNIYQINAQTKLSIRYNDASVLENYHISQAFKVMIKPECNLLSEFTPEEYRTIRRRIIECVLATDMANHSKHSYALKSKLECYNIKQGTNIEKLITLDSYSKNYENQQIVLSNIVHAADISNPAKPSKIYDMFVKLLFIEFFNQGDIEKKCSLPVSLLCDRETTNISKAQIGFITFIVLPTWELLYQISPEIEFYVNNIKTNLKRYEELVNKEHLNKINNQSK